MRAGGLCGPQKFFPQAGLFTPNLCLDPASGQVPAGHLCRAHGRCGRRAAPRRGGRERCRNPEGPGGPRRRPYGRRGRHGPAAAAALLPAAGAAAPHPAGGAFTMPYVPCVHPASLLWFRRNYRPRYTLKTTVQRAMHAASHDLDGLLLRHRSCPFSVLTSASLLQHLRPVTARTAAAQMQLSRQALFRCRVR